MENEKQYYSSAIKGENFFKKNRYTDVLALETSRIKLKNLKNDYINGNFVPGKHFNFQKGMNWIVTQGPTDETSADFWYMVTQEDVNLVVMLCRTTENGKSKCSQYWPHKEETKTFLLDTQNGIEYLTVTNTEQKMQKDDSILERSFVVRYKDIERRVTHLQYLGWPDHGVPSSTLAFRKLMELSRPHCLEDKVPVVHCSAGIGRSSTFIASMIIKEKLRYYLDHLEEFEGKHFDFEVFETVRQLRNFRSGSVQHKSQYEFIYQVMQEEAEALGYEPPTDEEILLYQERQKEKEQQQQLDQKQRFTSSS